MNNNIVLQKEKPPYLLSIFPEKKIIPIVSSPGWSHQRSYCLDGKIN